jgi:hypothetical protein
MAETAKVTAGSTGSGKAMPYEAHNYVGPYRLEKTLGKGQTGKPERLVHIHIQKLVASFYVGH